jgi:antiviral helicase SLH1
VLGAGRKLVRIAEMDSLCKRTFKGYKTLNRMQSLVYPIAYETNENMLICAPTGAVSLKSFGICKFSVADMI